MQNVLFHRDFRGFSGGHLKVWDYFNHVRHSPNNRPHIYFSKETVWDSSNPWFDMRSEALNSPQEIKPDILFLAGFDWLMVPESQRPQHALPIINLIQGIRHGEVENPRYQFLRHKAIRICVSDEVRSVVSGTNVVNGPVVTILNGIDLSALPECLPIEERDIDILIVGLKRPQIALRLYHDLKPFVSDLEVLTTRILRSDFLNRLNRAKITIFFPDETEGFYLPALEGMALGTLVVCPDCVGNRSFCLPGYNCFRPEYALQDILNAANAAFQLSDSEFRQMLLNAKLTVAKYDLMQERKLFLELLENVPQLW